MNGYSTRDVAQMLAIPEEQIRSLARVGVLEPDRGRRGEYRFQFRDLVLLRTARRLRDAKIPQTKITEALSTLKRQLPIGRPLSAVSLRAEGDAIVARDGRKSWDAVSGQRVFNFQRKPGSGRITNFERTAAEGTVPLDDPFLPEDWYDIGTELEKDDPETAREAYRRCLELDPAHPQAHVNVGRLLHESGELEAAVAHYKLALESQPDDPVGTYNLAVAMEDLQLLRRARECYLRVLQLDGDHADAHYNLARLYEQEGDTKATLRHLNRYRKLTRKD